MAEIEHSAQAGNGPASPEFETGRSCCAASDKDHPAQEMVVSVLLDSGGKIKDYYCPDINLKVGEFCVVDDNNQFEFGSVAVARHPLARRCPGSKPMGRVIRRANEEDHKHALANARNEKHAMVYCRERILWHDLKMSLTRVHYSFDEKKAVFYFTAENRVDFRELIKELSNYTRVRVEMRQIGVRDEARILGGCGPCGQELCCSKFLTDFSPVSIRMAKDQSLSLSPEKISGVCGRLMCCLSYEHDTYKHMLNKTPNIGKMARTQDGRVGKVFHLNLLSEQVGLIFDDGAKEDFAASELTALHGQAARNAKQQTAQAPQVKEERRNIAAKPPVEKKGGRKTRAHTDSAGAPHPKQADKRRKGRRTAPANPAATLDTGPEHDSRRATPSATGPATPATKRHGRRSRPARKRSGRRKPPGEKPK